MKLSYNWLKQYINLDLDAEELSVLLTDCGLEVENMEFHESIKGGLKGIKVGHVLTCHKHPNADKLSVTTVDIGTENPLPIVCGAPNVAVGQKVFVATVGTTLYSGEESFQIGKSKIRGEVSQGMICAEDELQLGTSHDGIMVLDNSFIIGADASDYVEVEQDYTFEIGLTPNRADATSHIGAARDLVAVINRFYPDKNIELRVPSVEKFKIDSHDLPIEIDVKNHTACPRYSGICIQDIEVKESPKWLKNKLEAVGLRPINNIVDITNYVLMETGQPLHAFDYDKIAGKKVQIQTLNQDTAFTTLDEVERKLDSQDLMICDAEKGMCIAGVFGGLSSGVKNDTKNIFLESAYFDPVYIRKTSKRHLLKTDASFRFERGADPNITVYALKRAALLIQELAGGKIASEIHDVYPKPINNWVIELLYSRLNSLIGQVIEKDMVRSILTNLDIKILQETDDALKLEIPTFKVDVSREVDVIEEVLRVYGYNHINFDEHIRSSINHGSKPNRDEVQNLMAEFLVANGYNEIMNNSLSKGSYYEGKSYFDSNKSIPILNPLSSELNVMRQSLLFGGLENIKRNINHKQLDLKLFEFGKHYSIKNTEETSVDKKYFESTHLAIFLSGNNQIENWKSKMQNLDFYDLKEILFKLCTRLGVDRSKLVSTEIRNEGYAYGIEYKLHQKTIAFIGKLSHTLLKEMDIEQDVFYLEMHFDNFLSLLSHFKTQYNELPKFPAVRRDLALLVDQSINYEQIANIASKTDKKLLKAVNLFDVYQGKGIEEGKKSYAISLVFQDETKTLTDKIIDKTVGKMVFILEKELGAKLR